MRKADFEHLEKMYSSEQEVIAGGPFSRAMGIDTQPIIDLYKAILSDLDQKGFGIGWWQAYEPVLDWKRRVLISDQLLKCVSSTEDNLLEAHLHFLEAKDNWEKYSEFMANSISVDFVSSRPVLSYPKATAASDLILNLRNIHESGFFRAIGSVADCLAGIIVGILGLPRNLKKADLEMVRNFLCSARVKDQIHQDFGEWFEKQVKSSGPEGWLSWATQYRNMLVHRARRLQIDSQKPTTISGESMRPLVDLRSIPYVRTSTNFHLAKNPELSDIEALIHNTNKPLLEESSETTMAGILKSIEVLMNSTLIKLLEIWNLRKNGVYKIIQPIAQWPNAPSTIDESFNGYFPGSAPIDLNRLVGSAELILRMRAASLAGDDINNWKRS